MPLINNLDLEVSVGGGGTLLGTVTVRYLHQDSPDAAGLTALGAIASPTPATHSILTLLKAGEAVCQTLFVPKLEYGRVIDTKNTVSDTFCVKNSV